MLSESEISKLIAEMNSIKSEVKELRIQLNNMDRKKEDYFREKRKISSDIFSRIKNAQDYKNKRNSLTDVVKNTKLSREEIEQRVKVLEEEVHKLKEEKHKIMGKLGIENPMMLKKQIKHLEFKIETEGLTFEKEKELMKVLSKMKKQYASVKGVDNIEHQLDTKFRDLRDLRSQLDMTKKIVQHSAKESQKHHIELIESSKDIDDLKDKEAEFEVKIGVIKGEMHTLNEQINEKLSKIDAARQTLKENNVQLKEDIERTNSEILKQKDEEVQDKLKNKKKLTTEDLLILQRTMRN